MGNQGKIQEEKELKAMSGYLMLFVGILGLVLGGAALLYGIMILSATGGGTGGWMILAGLVLLLIFFILLCGLKVINPNEALVLALFGNYYGTLKKDGFYWVNPFVSAINPTVKDIPATTGKSRKVSLKTRTLNNDRQKVNDAMGNPVEIAASSDMAGGGPYQSSAECGELQRLFIYSV